MRGSSMSQGGNDELRPPNAAPNNGMRGLKAFWATTGLREQKEISTSEVQHNTN
jgi:hypothetical protein